MTIRIECSAPGFERNWVEISDSWPRRDTVVLHTAQGDDFWDLLRRKVLACHIELETGTSIDKPEDITVDNIQDADELLIYWLGKTMPKAVAERRALGEVSARVSSNGKETPA